MEETEWNREVLSTPVTDRQVRDFTRRIFVPVANRFVTTDTWVRVGFEQHVDEEPNKQTIQFRAEWDAESDATIYHMFLADVVPIDSEWSPGAVESFFATQNHMNTGFEHPVGGLLNPVSDGGEPPGYLATEHQYFFWIPENWRNPHRYAKHFSFSILDEDGDMEDEVMGYSREVFVTQPVAQQDLECLYRYGEIALDTQVYESRLSEITIHDLQLILAAFKAIHVVPRSANVLSCKNLPEEIGT